MSQKLKAQETLPVVARDGRTNLGFCQVEKFSREPGQPFKQILIRDTQEETIALILVYKLHSWVRCGHLEMPIAFVESKDAVAVARAALESRNDPQERLLAIEMEAAFHAAQRQPGAESR